MKKIVSMSFKKLHQLNTHKAFRVSKKSEIGHFKDMYYTSTILDMVENAYEVSMMNRKKKQWSVGLLLCLIVSLEHSNLFLY